MRKEEYNKKYNKDYYKIRKKFIYDYNKIDFTKRVILPQNNTERTSPQKLRILTEAGKTFRRVGEGSYMSLMVRTPVSFPVKGRKKVNKSFDCGNKNDSVIFNENKLKEFINVNNVKNKPCGIKKKLRAEMFNKESEILPIKRGRRHFYGKIKDSKIF